MRECLGWVTNCENEQSCPQNWLEHAVTEIPVTLECHVCRRSVALVAAVGALESEAQQGELAAYPVVPPIGIDSMPDSSQGFDGPALDGLEASLEPEEPAASPPMDPVRAPTPVPARRQWVCTLANGETIRIDKESMTIGRSRACDVVIPSAKVSRQHANLSFSGGELWIEDLGSANGVWNNGEKVTRTKVGNGDTFTISDETLLFEVR